MLQPYYKMDLVHFVPLKILHTTYWDKVEGRKEVRWKERKKERKEEGKEGTDLFCAQTQH